MTNKHCDTCGDPLFRYEGQEFCPTCSQEGDAEGGATASETGSGEGAAPRSPDHAGTEQRAATEGVDAPERGTTQEGGPETDRVDTATAAGGMEAPTPDTGETATSSAADQRPASRAGDQVAPRSVAGGAGDVGGNVTNARAALSRKLAALARQAEATEDVGRSRELLAAAREAAEALAAIDDVGG